MMYDYIKKSDAVGICMEWCPDDDGSVGKTGDMREMIDEIENIAPEDVQPVVHAHWIKNHYDNADGTIYKCSNCNHELFSAWNFCPYCGARMDEEMEEKRKK